MSNKTKEYMKNSVSVMIYLSVIAGLFYGGF